MATDNTIYVLDKDGNAYEGLDREQTLAAITQAVESGTVGDVDTGFVSRLVEQNAKGALKFWVGTMAQYNELETKDSDTLYIFTDDTTLEDINTSLDAIAANVDAKLATALDEVDKKQEEMIKEVENRYQHLHQVRITGDNQLDIYLVAFSTSSAPVSSLSELRSLLGSNVYQPATGTFWGNSSVAFVTNVSTAGQNIKVGGIEIQTMSDASLELINGNVTDSVQG